MIWFIWITLVSEFVCILSLACGLGRLKDLFEAKAKLMVSMNENALRMCLRIEELETHLRRLLPVRLIRDNDINDA